jgi:hypothetical protein
MMLSLKPEFMKTETVLYHVKRGGVTELSVNTEISFLSAMVTKQQ